MKQCGADGPSGTEGDSASGIGQLRLLPANAVSPECPDGDQPCHNVTDDQSRRVVAALATALERWRTTPARDEIRAVLLRLLLELEAAT